MGDNQGLNETGRKRSSIILLKRRVENAGNGGTELDKFNYGAFYNAVMVFSKLTTPQYVLYLRTPCLVIQGIH